MADEERSIVSPTPGTTMDSVDTEITRDGRSYRFVDTAGIRRKGKTTLVAEKLSVVMAAVAWSVAMSLSWSSTANRASRKRRTNRQLCGRVQPVRRHRY